MGMLTLQIRIYGGREYGELDYFKKLGIFFRKLGFSGGMGYG